MKWGELCGIATLGALRVACATPAPVPKAAAPIAVMPPLAAAASAAVAAQKDKSFQAPYGYKRVTMTNGGERFCRYDTPTGTRTQHTKVCDTAAQLQAAQDSTASFIDQIQKHGVEATATCTPGAGAGGRICASAQGY